MERNSRGEHGGIRKGVSGEIFAWLIVMEHSKTISRWRLEAKRDMLLETALADITETVRDAR